MVILTKTMQKIVTVLLKDLHTHTATTLSHELHMSRQGTWKIIRQLEQEELLILKQIGKGKTSLQVPTLNWVNVLLEKILSLSLTQEAFNHKRWLHNFADLEKQVDFFILYGSILHSPKEANDIDVLGVAPEKNLSKINDLLLQVQETQAKKIHAVNLTSYELKQELKKPNRAFLDALKRGVVLFGQETFVRFMKGLQI